MIVKGEEGLDFVHLNPTEGGYKFFQYSTVDNKYGAGMIEQEPTLGVPCRNCGVDVDGTIVGALVLDEDGKICERFSWSNLVYAQKGEFLLSNQDELKVNGKTKGFFKAIFLADKNRIKGYVGVFGSAKPEQVKVLEMENLLLTSI